MRITIIGGTGHIGTYLIPKLVALNHQVTVVSRGKSKPYLGHYAWKYVERCDVVRDHEKENGEFGRKILSLKPDIVIDMICFNQESAQGLLSILKGNVQQILFCGTIWVHGYNCSVPTKEEDNINPLGQYGIGKARMTEYLLRESRFNNLPIVILHPGHIVGEGWFPVNPLGNFAPRVFSILSRGEKIQFPTLGLETVHHVHADDVAQGFIRAMHNQNSANGEDFHLVSDSAVTFRGYAQTVASWFRNNINMEFLSDATWKKGFTEEDIQISWDHILQSSNCSNAKAQSRIGFKPRYTSMEAVYESLMWLVEHSMIEL